MMLLMNCLMHVDLFHSEKLLAVGPAAKIYRGVEIQTGRKVMIKALLADHEAACPLDREKIQLLVPSLMQVRHPQIAGLITLLPTEDEFALVYEFMPGISGRAFPQEKKTSAADVRALAVQLMNALLVGEHLILPHGDLKPSNLIITDHPGGGLFLQVQDWGLSLARQLHPAETLWFRAPELHRHGRMSSQSDLFTAASSLFFLATGAAPAQGDKPEQILADLATFDLRGSLALMRPDLDAAFVDWLAWLLHPAPELRPASVAYALDGLMRSMQTGFVYQAQQAPQMMPGSATVPLVTAAANAPMPRPAVPKLAPVTVSKPALPKAPMTGSVTPRAPESKTTVPAVAPRKIMSGKVVVAVLLNLAALAALLCFFRPFVDGGGWRTWFAQMNDVVQATDPKVSEENVFAAPVAEGNGVKARYVKISMEGKGIISMAEVQVFSGTENIAYQGTATQSSKQWDGEAKRAIDGSTDGIPSGNSLSHTHFNDKDPWWQLDLGREHTLTTLVIWNRTAEDKYIDRLVNFTVSVLDEQQNVLWEKKITEVPRPTVKLVLPE
jgi:serine/threonine protein kinase